VVGVETAREQALTKFPAESDALRVMAIMDTYMVSGPARQLMSVVHPLRENGVDLKVVTFAAHDATSPFMRQLAVEQTAHVVIRQKSSYDPATAARLLDEVRRFDPHIIQSHGYRPTVLVALLRSRTSSIPWLAFFHGGTTEDLKTRFFHAVDRRLMLRASQRVVVANSLRSSFGEERCVVIDNATLPVHQRPAMPASVAASVAAMPRPLFGIVSRLSSEKGVDLALQAASCISARKPFGLVIVGDGPERAALQQQVAAEPTLADRTLFAGAFPAGPDFFGALQCVLLPSRSEGMPNVVLEALGSGLPVIGTDVGDVARCLSVDPTSVVVPPDNAVAMADAMSAMIDYLKAPSCCDAENRRRAVAEHFGVAQRVNRLVDVYRSLVSQ
jgi:glycosyltransferase involved in cell wall biosynthesis